MSDFTKMIRYEGLLLSALLLVIVVAPIALGRRALRSSSPAAKWAVHAWGLIAVGLPTYLGFQAISVFSPHERLSVWAFVIMAPYLAGTTLVALFLKTSRSALGVHLRLGAPTVGLVWVSVSLLSGFRSLG